MVHNFVLYMKLCLSSEKYSRENCKSELESVCLSRNQLVYPCVYIIGNFRLEFEYEIESKLNTSTIFEFKTSGASRALALDVRFG